MANPWSVLITTSGTGSRLGQLTKRANKCLLPLAGKPTICHIVDRYPPETRFVLTLGYLGDQVKTTVEKLYPDRSIEYVWVDPYEGPGSSQGYSELAAASLLQCPFVYHACDTILLDPIPTPDQNFVVSYRLGGDISQYRTHRVKQSQLLRIEDKGIGDSQRVHIGIAGFANFAAHWQTLQQLYKADPGNQGLGDTDVINTMLAAGHRFTLVETASWLDTGNPAALTRTEQEIAHHA